MKTDHTNAYSVELKLKAGSKNPALWLREIQSKLKGEPLNLQKWMAQIIVNRYPRDAAYNTPLDEFSDLFGGWRNEYTDEDQERAFAKLGLPYVKSEHYRKKSENKKLGRKPGANKRRDTFESLPYTVEMHRRAEATSAIAWHQQQMQEAGK